MPSWYELATEVRVIRPDAQRAAARRIGATVAELRANHVPSSRSRPRWRT